MMSYAATLVERFRERTFRIYLLTGIANTVFGYTVYTLIWWLVGAAQLALFVGTLFGVTFNMFTTGRYLFDTHQGWVMGRYLLIQFILYAGNSLSLWLLQAIGLHALIAQAILLPAVVIGGYGMIRYFLLIPLGKVT